MINYFVSFFIRYSVTYQRTLLVSHSDFLVLNHFLYVCVLIFLFKVLDISSATFMLSFVKLILNFVSFFIRYSVTYQRTLLVSHSDFLVLNHFLGVIFLFKVLDISSATLCYPSLSLYLTSSASSFATASRTNARSSLFTHNI